MKKCLLFTLILTAVACSKTESRTESSGGGGGGVSGQGADTTPYARCRSGSQATSPLGRWMASWEDKGLKSQMIFQISYNQFSVQNLCTMQGRSLHVYATSPATLSPSQITIHNNASDYDEIRETGFNLNCNVSVHAATVNYRYDGACLVLTGQGQSITLVPY